MNLQSYVNIARKQFDGLDKMTSKRELTGEQLSTFIKDTTYQKMDETIFNGCNRFFTW